MAFNGKHSDETKMKMSAAKRGIPKSPEHKAKIKEAHAKRNALIKQLLEQENKDV